MGVVGRREAGRSIVEEAPKKSSGSNGVVERGPRRLKAG